MEAKKSPLAAAPKDKPIRVSRTGFLSDVKEEFKKITWTEPDELRTYTKVVVGATFVFGMGVYFVDLILQSILSTLEFLMKTLIG